MALLTSGDGKFATSIATASISPTSGRLVVVSVSVDPNTTTIPNITGANITFSQSAQYLGWNGGGNGLGNTYVFTGVSDGTAGALTISCSDANGKIAWVISEHVAGAVIQSKTGLSGEASPSNPFGVTLDNALESATSIVLGICANNNYAFHAPNNGFTLEGNSGSTDEIRVSVISKVNDASPNATADQSWTTTSMIALELGAGTPVAGIVQTDTTPEDGVQQTVTCSNMTGPITAATLGGYDILSLLSGTDPASPITYTLDISALAEGTSASLPRLGVSLDLVFTTATDGAVTQSGIVIQSKTGWALVELEGTINKDSNGLIATIEADTGLTVTNADALYYETANNASITVNGVYTSDLTTAGQSTKIILQDAGTSPSTSYSDGFFPYGEAGGGSNAPKTKYRRFPWQSWNPL